MKLDFNPLVKIPSIFENGAKMRFVLSLCDPLAVTHEVDDIISKAQQGVPCTWLNSTSYKFDTASKLLLSASAAIRL